MATGRPRPTTRVPADPAGSAGIFRATARVDGRVGHRGAARAAAAGAQDDLLQGVGEVGGLDRAVLAIASNTTLDTPVASMITSGFARAVASAMPAEWYWAPSAFTA